VRLTAIAATDDSAFAGWKGDAYGCRGNATTVTIEPTAYSFTCQPTFSKQVLGTWKCVNGQDPTYGACCDLKDPTCPAFPLSCNASIGDEQWFFVSININPAYVSQLHLSNFNSTEAQGAFTAYAEAGATATLGSKATFSLAPQATLQLNIVDIVTFQGNQQRGVLHFAGKGLTTVGWAVMGAVGDASPLMQFSAIPRVVIAPPAVSGYTGQLFLFNAKNLAAGSVNFDLRFVDKENAVITGLKNTITLPLGTLVALNVSNLVPSPPTLRKIEVIHPDPAQRCTGEALTAFRLISNRTTSNWIGYGGQ